MIAVHVTDLFGCMIAVGIMGHIMIQKGRAHQAELLADNRKNHIILSLRYKAQLLHTPSVSHAKESAGAYGVLGLHDLVAGISRVLFRIQKRWIKIAGQQFQPSEIAKFSIVCMFSAMVAQYKEKMAEFRYGVLAFVQLAILIVLGASGAARSQRACAEDMPRP